MRFGQGLTNIVGSDNTHDGAAEGITSAMRYADLGKEGNRLAENLSSGLHQAANSQRINQKIRRNINENIATARRQYEFAQAVQKGEYDDALALEIRRMQAANARKKSMKTNMLNQPPTNITTFRVLRCHLILTFSKPQLHCNTRTKMKSRPIPKN